MGIARAMIKLLMQEGNQRKFSGNVLTAGRQDILATGGNLAKWAKEMRFELKQNIEMSLSDKSEYKMRKYIDDASLFLSLGFDSVESMDCSNFEQCTIVHDLNIDVPSALHDKFDVIVDSGTSEHIFNLPKVLQNYHKMLKVGGRIIHCLPSSNHVDHGFYMFSPTLFFDYYSANRWRVLDIFFIRCYPNHESKLWDIYLYKPGLLELHSFGALKGMYLIFVVVQKTGESKYDASVQQGYCFKEWHGLEMPDYSFLKRLKRFIPQFVKNYQDVILSFIPLRFFLKRVARY